MKKIFYAFATVAALTAISCSKEAEIQKPEPQVVAEKPATLTAQVGDVTKVSADNAGTFKWQAHDQITIITADGERREFEAGNTPGLTTDFSGTIPEGDNLIGGYALYPASSGHKVNNNTVTFNIPSEITWSADASNMPMFASIVDDGESNPTASFKAVGGVLKLICYNIPDGATTLAFTAASMKICGDFTLDLNAEHPSIQCSESNSDKEIDIDFSESYSSSKVFYIPLPVGTLNDGFTITIFDGEFNELFTVTSPKAVVIARNTIVVAPALNCAKETVLWSEDFSGYSANDVPENSSQFTSVTYSCVDGASATKIYNDALAEGTAPELLVGKNGGSFTVEGIPTKGNSSLSLTYRTNAKVLNISSSNTNVLITPSSTNTKEEHSLTISNPDKDAAITLVFAAASDNVRIDDIKVFIPGQSFTAPTIISDDELNIGVGESSASTVIELTNGVDGLGISLAGFTGDNADKFTAAIEGGTLTISAVDEVNATADPYTATLTLKATGAAKEISVSQASALVPNPTNLDTETGNQQATITFTKDAKAISYVAYLHTAETDTPATGGDDVSSQLALNEGVYSLNLTELTNNQPYHLYVKVNTVAEHYVAPSEFAVVEFTPVAEKTLDYISLDTDPTKMTYAVGESFNIAGAVVTAHFSDESTAVVTSDCTSNFDSPTTFDTIGSNTVTISYTYAPTSTTRTVDVIVTVKNVDVLNNAWTGINGTNYTSKTGLEGSSSDAIYSVQAAGGNSAIQLRTTNSNSGIVTTESGGVVKKITIAWNNNTADERVLDVYGKNSAYTAPSDLYSTSTQGTKVTSFTKSAGDAEYTFTTDYEYIGFRSNSGAMYINEITIEWGEGAPKYDITIDNSIENGSVSASPSGSQTEGTTISLTATPAAGYVLDEWNVYKTGDENTKVTVTSNQFTMPAYGVTVSASFVSAPTISMNTTSITGVAAAGVTTTEASAYSLLNGASNDYVTITCDETVVTAASKNATAGTINYTVAANTGAARDGWIKVKYGTEDAHTITVSQLVATYTLSVAVADNGAVSATVGASTITEGQNLSVAYGATVNITATADDNYSLSTLVYNDGSDHDIKSAKTFTMPAHDVTVTATFEEDEGGIEVGTVLFTETFGSTAVTPFSSYTGTGSSSYNSASTLSYTCKSSNTKIMYDTQGECGPANLLVGGNNGGAGEWAKISGIKTYGATKVTVTWASNGTVVKVSIEESSSAAVTSAASATNSGTFTLTGEEETITLVMTAGSKKNGRVDSFQIVVAE